MMKLPCWGRGEQLIYFQGKMKFGKLTLSSISQQIPVKLGKRMPHRMKEKMIKKDESDEIEAGKQSILYFQSSFSL